MDATPDQDIHSARFRRERQETWIRLEVLLERLRGRGEPLTPDELAELPRLYRTTLSSLSVARNYVIDQRLTAYLEALCLRAYLAIYAPRDSFRSLICRAVAVDFPRAVRGALPEIAVAALCLAIGILAGRAIVLADPTLFDGIVPSGLAGGRSPDAPRSVMVESITDATISVEEMRTFALFLAQHNAAVALLAFGLGLAFGLPTILLLLFNGVLIGAMIAAFEMHGLTLDFIAWLSVHGVTELGAIVIAGGGGLLIARGILFPGADESRLASARRRGLQAGFLMIGAVVMLFLAAALEGFARQMVQPTDQRLLIGLATGTVWVWYFWTAGRPGGQTGQ